MESSPDILKGEVLKVMREAKSGKAVEPDKVHAEVLKTLEEDGLDALTALFNKIYRTGVLPDDWLKSTFIPLPKKPNARRSH